LRTDKNDNIVIEVISHIESNTVRCIALTSVHGLKRGTTIIDTINPIEVPIGDNLLGKILHVFGETIDNLEELETDEKRSIYGMPVSLSDRTTGTEIFTTGIKVIDPLQSGSKMLAPHIVGEKHYRIAQQIRKTLSEYEELKDIIAMLGMEELSREYQKTVHRAR